MSDESDNKVSSVPRIIVLARLMWRCSFSIFAVLAGVAVLAAVPQAREALQAGLAPRDGQSVGWHQAPFLVAFFYWSVSAWLVARLLLSRKFDPDALGVPPKGDTFANFVAKWMPRVLAFVALLPVTWLTFRINGKLGLITGGITIAILTGLVLRTRFGGITQLQHSYGAFTFIGPLGWQAVLGFMALSATLLAGLWSRPAGMVVAMLWMLGAVCLGAWSRTHKWPEVADKQRAPLERECKNLIWPGVSVLLGGVMLVLTWKAVDEVDLARLLGAPALLLFALGSWTMFGGFVLTYLPLSWRLIGLATWLPLALFVAWGWRETHFVAQRDFKHEVRVGESAREAASERFRRWVDGVHPGDPVYMVAAAGGASRAAYWTGSVLAAMEDEARLKKRPFAANMFAISSISGSSLGATAFVAGIAQFPDATACKEGLSGKPPASQDSCLATHLRGFLKGDFLAPVMARMLFPDLFIRFVPVPQSLAARADRSLGLEEAWAGDWRDQFGSHARAVDWDAPMSAMYEQAERGGASRLPLLLLNTVRLEDGERFMQSFARPDWPGVTDLADSEFDTRRLSLAQAVHNSARFPYVSPGALVLGMPSSAAPNDDKGPKKLGRLGDGGYHEGSGAATLADLIERLVAEKLLRTLPDGGRLWACPGGWDKTVPRGGCARPSPVVAIILDNSPSKFPDDYVRGLDGREIDAGRGVERMLLPEALGPVFGGLSTRTQLSLLSQQRLSRLVGVDPSSLIEVRMPHWLVTSDDDETKKSCRNRDNQPSLNWYLDDCSRERLTQASQARLHSTAKLTPEEQALQNNLQRLRQLVHEPG